MEDKKLIVYKKDTLALLPQAILPVLYEKVNDSYYSFTYRLDQNTSVRMDESYNNTSKSDCVGADFESNVHESEKAYYAVAAASGLLSGTLSLLNLEKLVEHFTEWKEKDLKEFIIKVAHVAGYKKKDYKGAVKYIQNKIAPFAKKNLPSELQDTLIKYLRYLSSNTSIVGLAFSIITQFKNKQYWLDEKGDIHSCPVPAYYAIGKTTTDKILYGFLYWVFSLLVDTASTEKAVLEELNIPKRLIEVLKELASLPVFKSVADRFYNAELIYSNWIRKTFEESVIMDVEGETSKFNFADTVKSLASDLIKQSIPVIVNECIFRGFYFFRKLRSEISAQRIQSLNELDKIDPQNILPFNNKIVSHMAVIACGVFSATNIMGATVRAFIEKEKKGFVKTFIANISFAGIGSFVIAVANDSQYWGEGFKVIFAKKTAEDTVFDTVFSTSSDGDNVYGILSLSPTQARLQYCLEYHAVLYDIRNTKKSSDIDLKKKWLQAWQKSIVSGFEYQDADYFESNERVLYDYFYEQSKDKQNWRWIYLLTMELALFEPYHPLGTADDRTYKKLSVARDYMEEVFVTRQTVVSQKVFERIKDEYKSAYSRISGRRQNSIFGAGVVIAVVIASGGLAFAFAPQIAVAIAGEAVVGLHGAALTSASLAFVGGGALAAGGAGMAGGIAIITGGGALLGLAGSGGASAVTMLLQTPPGYWTRQGAKLVTFSKVVLHESLYDDAAVKAIYAETITAAKKAEDVINSMKKDRSELDKEAIDKLSDYQKCLDKTANELKKIVSSK